MTGDIFSRQKRGNFGEIGRYGEISITCHPQQLEVKAPWLRRGSSVEKHLRLHVTGVGESYMWIINGSNGSVRPNCEVWRWQRRIKFSRLSWKIFIYGVEWILNSYLFEDVYSMAKCNCSQEPEMSSKRVCIPAAIACDTWAAREFDVWVWKILKKHWTSVNSTPCWILVQMLP